MNGVVELVPLAELLAEIGGGRADASRIARQVLNGGSQGLDLVSDDLNVSARRQLLHFGIITSAGCPNLARAAELLLVCEILAATNNVPAIDARQQRLLLSAPADGVPISDSESLDAFVIDVIRRASNELHIGGAFWNDGGFDLLDEVLIPALGHRRATTTIWVNQPSNPTHDEVLKRRLEALNSCGQLKVRWFCGPRPTMLHAKFVIADQAIGYLGSANLTSWGMHGHIEAGVELSPRHCVRFIEYLTELETAGFFRSNAPSTKERYP